jgi:hypothetical protein
MVFLQFYEYFGDVDHLFMFGFDPTCHPPTPLSHPSLAVPYMSTYTDILLPY